MWSLSLYIVIIKGVMNKLEILVFWIVKILLVTFKVYYRIMKLNDSLHLVRKYINDFSISQIFVGGHYLFRKL